MSSHSLGRKGCAVVAWEDKHHNYKCTCICLLALRFYCWAQCHMARNIPLVNWGQLCPLPASCPCPTYWWEGDLERKTRCCAGTAQQKPKHWCDINSVLAAKAKHGTVCATRRKVNSISVRDSTSWNVIGHDTDLSLERDIHRDTGMDQEVRLTLNCDNNVFQIVLLISISIKLIWH